MANVKKTEPELLSIRERLGITEPSLASGFTEEYRNKGGLSKTMSKEQRFASNQPNIDLKDRIFGQNQ